MHYYLKSKHLFIGDTTKAVSGILEIKDGRIVGHFDYNTPVEGEILDAGDKLVVPGFIDAHVHLYLSALIHLGKMKAVGGPTIDEVVLQASSIPEYNGWKIGIGWYASDFGQQVLPTKEDLDRASTDVPICLIAGDAHTIWLNSKALEVLELTPDAIPQNIGGEAVVADGELTGVFLEAKAIYYLSKVLSVYKEDEEQALKDYMSYLNKMGVTAVGDVALTGESPDDIVYPELYSKVEKDATVRVSFFPAMREEVERNRELYKTYRSDMLQMGGVKQFYDGVTSSHTAYLKEPYPMPFFEGDVGGPLLTEEKMERLTLLANKEGWPMRIHTVGDKAIALTLQNFKKAQEETPFDAPNKFNTIEHLEVMDPTDLPLTAQPSLIVSVQPSHLLVGYETLDEEVGAERSRHMFPFKSFLEEGATLGFGTDTPVVLDVTPFESMFNAVARQTKEQLPVPCLMPEQRISIGEALKAHTSGAAKALSRLDIGTLEVGSLADFVILDKNILESDAVELLNTNVEATFVNGKCVYKQ